MQRLECLPSPANYDVVIAGAGLSGAVIAQQMALQDFKCLVIDRRDHIGGNCYDYRNKFDILVNKYGAHIFHTNKQRVWNYINKFGTWERWEHKVLAYVDDKYVPIPVNITTTNMLLNQSIDTEQSMQDWLKKNQVKYEKPIENSEEMAKSRVGEILYEKMFRDYTKKQWGRYPDALDASVLARIPLRANFDTRYFADKYQALPKLGYTHFFENILNHPNIDVLLNTDYFDVSLNVNPKVVVFTGPIDQYYSSTGMPSLEYRSIKFVEEHYENMNFYQPSSVVNYPSLDVDWTRVVEYKHFLNQMSPHTTVVKEFPAEKGEPFYPIPSQDNLSLYEKYKCLADKDLEKGLFFVGRLANYKYFNMDEAIDNALNIAEMMLDHPAMA